MAHAIHSVRAISVVLLQCIIAIQYILDGFSFSVLVVGEMQRPPLQGAIAYFRNPFIAPSIKNKPINYQIMVFVFCSLFMVLYYLMQLRFRGRRPSIDIHFHVKCSSLISSELNHLHSKLADVFLKDKVAAVKHDTR